MAGGLTALQQQLGGGLADQQRQLGHAGLSAIAYQTAVESAHRAAMTRLALDKDPYPSQPKTYYKVVDELQHEVDEWLKDTI